MVSSINIASPAHQSYEEQDILFGLTTQEQRDADVQARARALAATEKSEKIDVEHEEMGTRA